MDLHREISVVLATGDELLRPVVGEVPEVKVAGLVYLAEHVVEVIAEVSPQVLILADFMDPNQETVKMVRHQFPGTRIIYIITGEDEEPVKGVLIKLGIYDFLPHTFKKSELLKLIQHPRGWQDLCSAGLLLDDLIAEPFQEAKGAPQIQDKGRKSPVVSTEANVQKSPVISTSTNVQKCPIISPAAKVEKAHGISPAASQKEVGSTREGGGGFTAIINNMLGRGGLIRESTEPREPAAVAGRPEPPTPAIRVVKQQVVAFWSGKPGVGKTFLAVNTAIALARAGVKVALVDGDILNLSAGVLLNLQDVRKTLERALKVNRPGDIGEFLLYHPQFPKLAVLTGSDLCRPEGYCTVEKEAVTRLIQYLKGDFDVVIIDTATDVQSVTTYVALQEANQVFLVTNQDYAQVFAAKRQLALLKRLRVPLEKFQLVLNGELKGCKISPGMLEDTLGLQLVQVLPHMPKQVMDSIFDARPVVLQKGQEALGLREGLESLAQKVFPVLNEEKVSLLENLSRLLRKKGSINYG